MLLAELFEEIGNRIIKGAGWINVKTYQWVGFPDNSSHVATLVNHPDEFGINPINPPVSVPPVLMQCWDKPDELSLNEHPEILQFMSQLGWTRVVHKTRETSIQAESIKEARLAARYLYEHAGGIKNLVIHIGGNYDDGKMLDGEDLTNFIYRGRNRI